MKRGFIAAMALIMALSFAGCGNKKNTANNSKSTDTPAEEKTVQQQLDDFGKGASENADMKKVDGKELKEEKIENSAPTENTIGSYDISVDDAKIIDYNNSKVILVSFGFKNNSDSEVNFSGVTVVETEQNGSALAPTVVTDVEGFDSTTLAQNVEKGKKITVQRAYKLSDEENPVTVSVRAFDSNAQGNESVSKTFNVK